MARDITVTFVDGTSHVYKNAGDDTTPAAAQARAEKDFSKPIAHLDGGRPAETPSAAPPSTMAVVSSAPYKAIGGIADTFLNAPQNVINLGKAAYGTLATAAGYPNAAPDVTAPPERVTNLLRRAGFIKPTENMTTGQRILDVGLQAATGGALSPARSGAELARSALTGAASGVAGQAVTEATGSPLAGLVTSVVVPTAANAAAQARQTQLRMQQSQNAVRDLTIRAGQNEGYVTTPGSVTPTGQNVLIERVGGKTRLQQEAATKNQTVTDRLARRAGNLPEDAPLTRANMQTARNQEFDRGYTPVANIGPVNTDPTFVQSLDDVLAAYTGPGRSFPNAIPQPVTELVNNYRVGQFNSADAIGATRTLRAESRANMARGDTGLGLAQRAISNALEDQVERSLQAAGTPNAQATLDQFRASRQRMAILHSIEDAIVEGGGSVNARQLANDLQTRGRYFSGDLDIIAKFANVARPVMTPPGTTGTPGAGGILGPTIGGGFGALAGNLMGGPQGATMGAMAGAGAPGALSFAARQYLLSRMGQNRALPNYDVNAPSSPALRNALIGLPVAKENALAPK
jgi:hypothetical protein